ncbi:MAG: hypothetical protein SGARI_007756 [Bacillariaceae sp.]
MMGQRYEVTAETIPVEMVMAVTTSSTDVDDEAETEAVLEDDNGDVEVNLTPEVAIRIADRCEEVGFFLLLEPELDPYQDFDEKDDNDDGDKFASLTPNECS